MMLCIGLAGYACFREGGVESRFGKEIAILSDGRYFNGKTAEQYLGTETCFLVTSTYESFEKNGCEEKLFPGQPKVFLIGDSHMTFLSLGLREFLSSKNYNIYQYSAAHCTPLSLNDKRDRCRDINQHVLEKIKKEKPDFVVIFAYYIMVQADSDYGEGIPYDEFLYQKTIELEREGIKHVLLVGHMPLWTGTLPELLGRKFVMHGKPIPERTYEGIVQDSLDWDKKLREKSYPANVTYVSLKDFLCDKSGCITVVGHGADEDLLVFDYGHLTIPGARFITENLISKFFDTSHSIVRFSDTLSTR
jgi:hypothetical protein